MRTTLRLFCLVILMCVEVPQVFCADGNDAKNLSTKLFVTDKYDKKVRPTNDQSNPIAVYVSLFLLSIHELSETTETLKTTGYLWILWDDEFLTWTPDDYGGLEYYHWPQGDVWKPDVALKNSFLEYKELGISSLNVQVYSTGLVHWYPFQVFQSTCSVDITYYPFDTQDCKLKFVAWSYTKAEVDMFSGDKGIDMSLYEPSSEWDVVDTNFTVDHETYESEVVFSIKIKRKPLHVLLSVMTPIIMLAILNVFVFVLPCESGEKASYAITVFLAFAVFLSIVSSTFPENSEQVAFFSIFLIIQTLQSTLITLLALVLIRCSSFDDDLTPVPRWLQAMLCVTGSRPCCQRRQRRKVADCKHEQEYIEERAVEFLHFKYSWKQAANMLDKVFFAFFSITLVTSTLVFFISTAVINKTETENHVKDYDYNFK